MTWIQRIKNFFQSVNSSFVMLNRGLAESGKSMVLVDKFTSWVYVCASRNAAAVAAVPIRMYKQKPGGKKELIEEHPFLDLWCRPNPNDNGYEFVERLQLYLEVCGNAYSYVINNSLGVPAEQYIIPAQYMHIVVGENGKVKGYLYDDHSKKVSFSPKEIVHFAFPTLRASPYGYSPIEAMHMAVNRYESMDTLEKSLLDNGAVPSYIVNYKGKLSEKVRKDLEREWNSAYRGPDKQGKIKVADEDLEVKELGFSLKDMTFPEGRKWTRTEIADAYGIPLALLDTETVNKANALTALNHYQKFTVLPRIMRIEERVNSHYLPMYDIGSKNVWVEFDSPVTDDYEFRLKEREVHVRLGITTPNEERAKLNLPPVEGGDTLHNPDSAAPSAMPYNYQETRSMKRLLPPLTASEKRFKNALQKFMEKQRSEALGVKR